MAKLDIYNLQWLEVVFADRNKAYGAYELRRDNNKTTSKALMVGGILFILAISAPLIAKYIGGNTDNEVEKFKETEVVLVAPPPIDKVVVPPPPSKEPPKPKVSQVKFPPPVVVPKEQVQEEEPPTLEDLKEADPGQKTLEGDPNADIRIDEAVGTAPPRESAVTEDTGVYTLGTVEVMPEFPGGLKAFYKFVGNTYSYPAAARENGVSGKVIMSFVVEKDGSLTQIKIVRDLGMGTGEEAIRVLKKTPKWKPGIQNGRPVRVAYTLPIALELGAEF